MSVWALIRKVRADLGPDAEALDRSLVLLNGYWMVHADVLSSGPARFALPEALIDEVVGPGG